MKKLSSLAALFFFVLMFVNIIAIPTLAHAAAETDDNWFNGLVPCGKEINAVEAANSCDFNALVTMGKRVVNFLFYASILMTVCLLVWTGYQYITAGSNTGQLAQAKKTFLTVGIGFLLVLGAWLIINTVVDVLLNPEAGIDNPLQ